MDTSEIGRSRNGVIRNDQILEMGVPTASALQLEGESSMRLGNIDRAIVALQRAIELAPGDADKRLMYAEALEKKLMSQKTKDRDPRFYNFVVKQWLYILQSADFPDQKMQAGSHLAALTGSVPRMFEKPHKYLARVLLPEDGSKPVLLGGAKSAKKQVATNSKDDDPKLPGF
jgi:tetratricopeptide (TPR) repeat protein